MIFLAFWGGTFFNYANILFGRQIGGRDCEGIMHFNRFLEPKIEFERMFYLSGAS